MGIGGVSLVEADEDEKNLLVLNEVRKMNRLQRENNKSIDKMSGQITYYQDLFDTVIANNRNTNQSIVREIRVNLIRLSILANPNMATMYRRSKKKIGYHAFPKRHM
jgi:flagellar biosynthesis regulator FlaF